MDSRSNSILLAIALTVSLVIGLTAPVLNKFISVGFRKRMLLTDLFTILINREDSFGVSFEAFEEAYQLISQAYKVDIQKIRPEDPMKIYFDIDSYHSGDGTEWIVETLQKRYGVQIKEDDGPDTVYVFICLVERLRKNSHNLS